MSLSKIERSTRARIAYLRYKGQWHPIPSDTEIPYFKSRIVCAKVRKPWQQDRRAPELEGGSRRGRA
jgi:hypothetical protein